MNVFKLLYSYENINVLNAIDRRRRQETVI